MKISLRGWIVLGTMAATLAIVIACSDKWVSAADEPAAATGKLTHNSLGDLLDAMGLSPKRVEQRFDFDFKAIHGQDEWQLSMSAVLSQNGDTIWVMAWLDELPRSAADVPRTGLLRLLAANDGLGNGKFFAYVSANRRFVLQRVISNQEVSTASFHEILEDLGAAVVMTYPSWHVENWKQSTEPAANEAAESSEAGPQLKSNSSASAKGTTAAGNPASTIRK